VGRGQDSMQITRITHFIAPLYSSHVDSLLLRVADRFKMYHFGGVLFSNWVSVFLASRGYGREAAIICYGRQGELAILNHLEPIVHLVLSFAGLQVPGGSMSVSCSHPN